MSAREPGVQGLKFGDREAELRAEGYRRRLSKSMDPLVEIPD